MTQSFSEHLLGAIARPLNLEIFTRDYEAVLESIQTTATFDIFGMKINSPESVYMPHDQSSTRFVLSRFESIGMDKPCGKFLEIGSGAGAIAIKAAQFGWEVTATDINPAAVNATKNNAEINNVAVRVIQSDLFAALPGEKFDVIVFNEPFYHVQRDVEEREIALSAPGGSLHQRFMSGALDHLHPGGKVIFSYSNCSDVAVLNQPGWKLSLESFDYESNSNYVRVLFTAKPQ